ncbi:unnamed protein product [Diatraea saccharalis]|uniref:Uncharacterized protein n=1 Tax=Diatraea saccharalis TaxID=40085 RepID=A0A9N9R9R4_9NEOP|nr:unnamed protein product [Diatraea saccharalis]
MRSGAMSAGKYKVEYSPPPGYDLPRPVWKSLNRLRTQVGRSKDNRSRWGFTNTADLACRGGTTPQTTPHLICCPACPYTCTQEDLMTAADSAVKVAEFWAGDI